MALVTIFYVKLQSDIGRKSAKVLGSLVFGMIAMFVELKYFSIDLNFLVSSKAAKRSHPKNPNNFEKIMP